MLDMIPGLEFAASIIQKFLPLELDFISYQIAA